MIRQHIAELLTRQDVSNLINNVKENNPALVDELTPKLLGIGEIQKVLQNLLREGISIRDLLTIFETLADTLHHKRYGCFDRVCPTEFKACDFKEILSFK